MERHTSGPTAGCLADFTGEYLDICAVIYLRHEQGHLPLPPHLRAATLARKREEYASLVELTFARGREGLDQQIWHQIEIDVPRTRPGVQLWMQAATQRVIISVCLLRTTKF